MRGRPKVLLTGGAGYIGSHTAIALCACYDVVALDNLSRGHRELVPPGVELVTMDVRDREGLKALFRSRQFSTVMHFAALAYVGESMQRPGNYFEVNVAGSQNLLDAMIDAGVEQLVLSSTCAVYGVPQYIPLTEDHPMAPVNPYGESKAAVERMLRWYGEAHGLRSVRLRYFNAGGADPGGRSGEWHDPEPHLIPRLLRAGAGGDPFPIYGSDYDTPDGTAIRDYIHVSDLAAAHVAAMDYLQAGGQSLALNLGAGAGTSVLQMVAQTESVLKCRVRTTLQPRRAGDPPVLVADARRARQVLNWTPQFTIHDQILTAWQWSRKQRPAAAAQHA